MLLSVARRSRVCTLLPISVTRGRGARHDACSRSITRPSFKVALALASVALLQCRRPRRHPASPWPARRCPGDRGRASPGRTARPCMSRPATSSSRLPLRTPWLSPAWMAKLSRCAASENACTATACGCAAPYCFTSSVSAPGLAPCSGSVTSTSLGFDRLPLAPRAPCRPGLST